MNSKVFIGSPIDKVIKWDDISIILCQQQLKEQQLQ